MSTTEAKRVDKGCESSKDRSQRRKGRNRSSSDSNSSNSDSGNSDSSSSNSSIQNTGEAPSDREYGSSKHSDPSYSSQSVLSKETVGGDGKGSGDRDRSGASESSGERDSSGASESSGERDRSGDGAGGSSVRCAMRTSSAGGSNSGSCVSAAACATPKGKNYRLQRVVDKPVLDGASLLSIEEFLSLSSGNSTVSSSPSFSFLADPSPPADHSSSSSAASSTQPVVDSSSSTTPPSSGASPAVDASTDCSLPGLTAAARPSLAASAAPVATAASSAAAPSAAAAAPSATGAGSAVATSTSAASLSVAGGSGGGSLSPTAAASPMRSCSAARASTRVAVGPGVVRDAFIIEDVFSERECEWLCTKTESEAGYTYWDTTGAGAISFRNAFTVEMRHPQLAAVIWDRVKTHVVETLTIGNEDEARAERDLLGEWIASGINSNLLFARYTNGGHFSPHTDGCTAMDFNTRSFWPALLYLNAVTDGGETLIIDDAQKSAPMSKDAEGRHTAQRQWIVEAVKPLPGRMLFFYYTQLHESRSVGPGAIKYIIRTDVLYTRKLPLLTSPADKDAFALWQKAQVLAEEGMTEEAASLFRRSIKMSPALAEVYGM